MANYEDDYENEVTDFDEQRTSKKYPEVCPYCEVSNPDQADSCINCEKKFEPEEQENNEPDDSLDPDEDNVGLSNPEAGGYEEED